MNVIQGKPADGRWHCDTLLRCTDRPPRTHAALRSVTGRPHCDARGLARIYREAGNTGVKIPFKWTMSWPRRPQCLHAEDRAAECAD
jgi:hypothetical protein